MFLLLAIIIIIIIIIIILSFDWLLFYLKMIVIYSQPLYFLHFF